MDNYSTKISNFIALREKLYFRAITILIILILFLTAERFQDLVVFVSVGLLLGGIYYRRKEKLIDIGTFIGAGFGLIFYLLYFLIQSLVNLL